jgi:hypothetical protein
MVGLTWMIEAEMFPESHQRLTDAVSRAGCAVATWNDEWWINGRWPRLDRVVFHGSLGNAARIRAELPWRPGAFCTTQAFHCSAWYPRAKDWLLHRRWVSSTVESLVSDAPGVLKEIGAPEIVFVRPDSPLKPFTGRVLRSDAISLKALDHGFYYDDESLPIIAAPVQKVGNEWRYVVVEGRVVAGSAYEPAGRSARADDPSGEPWSLASRIGATLAAPEATYVMDICESDAGLRLLELNPFSGADLYASDRDAVVAAVSKCALQD